MFEWLKRRKQREGLPEYGEIRKRPTRGTPPELNALEGSDEFKARMEVAMRWFGDASRRPREDQPLFTELVARDQRGVVTVQLPDGSRCLPVFGTPYRAFDSTRVHFATGETPVYVSSSPINLASLLEKLRQMGISQFALDTCPRCNIVVAIDSASARTAEDLIRCWMLSRSMERVRTDLFVDFACEAALTGKPLLARNVALEAVGHVNGEDPRLHFLLGQVAVALEDRELLGEAKFFLEHLGHDPWARRLDESARARQPDFEIPSV